MKVLTRFCWTVGVLITLASQSAAAEELSIFSGPQVGEELPPFKAMGVLGEFDGKEIKQPKEVDVITHAEGRPVLLMFVHERTRPTLGLTNLVAKYAATRAKDGLQTAIIFLTDDATSIEQWMRIARGFLAGGITYGISFDGQEGPGSYGLNRNVALTVLVGAKGKVTANLALVQPSVQADGPKILKAVVEATGGGKVPTIEELGGDGYRNRAMMAREGGQEDPELRVLLRSVISRRATPEDVKAAVAAVDDYAVTRPGARAELGRIAQTIVESGKLADYGTASAQQALRQWAKKYGELREEEKSSQREE